ncbi:hypothetical protein EFY79_00225 [Hanamia caeni]|uniref:Uncharacterized protein n=1 Tax=Hanamia caeni TaxID=2294116 RepID=A0A3M9NPQ9_9BACT|nr:hypothetical protein EFY79_00225 [Hanamia caeni]
MPFSVINNLLSKKKFGLNFQSDYQTTNKILSFSCSFPDIVNIFPDFINNTLVVNSFLPHFIIN